MHFLASMAKPTPRCGMIPVSLVLVHFIFPHPGILFFFFFPLSSCQCYLTCPGVICVKDLSVGLRS